MNKIVKNIVFAVLITTVLQPMQVSAMEQKDEQINWNTNKLLLGGALSITGSVAIYFVGKKFIKWWKYHDADRNFFNAVEYGTLEDVKGFVEYGADVNAIQDADYNWTPLHHASWWRAEKPDNLQLIKYLIEKGANVNGIGTGVKANQPGDRWCSPLHLAAERGNLPVVKCLIENGADVNAVSGEFWGGGGTPLHVASHWEIVQYLIEKSANINAQDLYGNTALHRAASQRNYSSEVAKIANNRLTIQILIENNVNINAKNKDGRTALHLAVKEGNLDAVKLLIESGANIYARDLKGTTARQLVPNVRYVPKYLERAANLYEAMKNPSKFDELVKKPLEKKRHSSGLRDKKKEVQVLIDAIGIIAAVPISTLNPEFLSKLFVWMNEHKKLNLQDRYTEGLDTKWFYLDLAYQAKDDHVKHAWLKKCFTCLETTVGSAFDAAVDKFIKEKGAWGKPQKNKYEKYFSKAKKLECQKKELDRQKRWNAIWLEKNKGINKIIQQHKTFEPCKDKMVVNGFVKLKNLPSFMAQRTIDTNKKKNFFDDINISFKS